MPYANISEVSACLEDCIEYCREHPELDYCARFGPELLETCEDLRETWRETDEYFAKWRREAGEDKVSWKKLASTLREVQRRLERVDAIGYPSERVMYWDEPLLEVAVRDMMEYLSERTEDIDFAREYIDRMEQLLDVAEVEHDESRDALRSYRRHYRARRDSLSKAYHVLGLFRDSMRRDVGTDHPEYKEIRWAWSVSPDQSVL